MIAVILCGGQSSRMGADKGLIHLHGVSLARRAYMKLTALSIPVVLSVNENQQPVYETAFPGCTLIKDNAAIGVNGPLLGVLSVHLQYLLEDLFVLACDMPLVTNSSMQLLLEYYQQQLPEACVFISDAVHEPLCGIYSARGLSVIAQRNQTGQLVRHSMKSVLDQLQTLAVPLPADQKGAFRNCNTAADLKGL